MSGCDDGAAGRPAGGRGPPLNREGDRDDAGHKKLVYFFGGGEADGRADMKNLLGGKGANLAEMAKLGMPVPAGFTITTEVCTDYYENGRKYPDDARGRGATPRSAKVEKVMGMKFGDPDDPLLVSVRSGARKSMPGMMETVLNVGLCSTTIPGLIAKTGNERFVYDAYRRLIMMYSDVVMEKAEGIEPAEGKGIREQLERMIGRDEEGQRATQADTDLTGATTSRSSASSSRRKVKEVLGKRVPGRSDGAALGRHRRGVQELERQAGRLLPPHRGHPGRVGHRGQRADHGLRQHGRRPRPPAWPSPATRPPARTSSTASGWSTPRARTWWPASARPNPLNEATKNEQNKHLPSLETAMPEVYKQLDDIRTQAREALPRHAGHRVHDPGRHALHAPVPHRQADRHGGAEHGDGHARGEADRRTKTAVHARRAGPARRAAAPDRRPGGREEAPSRSPRACRPGPGGAVRPDRLHRGRRRGLGQGRARRSSSSARRPTPRTSRACARRRASSPRAAA